MCEQIDISDVKKKYNSVKEIWPISDHWHTYTTQKIKYYVNKYANEYFNKEFYILNAGSGGNDYGLNFKQMHVDIAENKIKKKELSLVSDICNMPFDDASFDSCICVGSVLNYCDLIGAINELTRVVKKSGYLIIEYESSRSFEFLNSKAFNASAKICDTFYQGTSEKIWVYSPKYFNEIIVSHKLKIIKCNKFHMISPFIYKISNKENFSSNFAILDNLMCKIPYVNAFSSNIILICQKAI